MISFWNKKINDIDTRFLFVIGTGRSGTHFIGRIIGKHPRVEFLLEDTTTFNLSKKAAIPEPDQKYINRLITHYKKIQEKSEKRFVLEKSHPNIWITDSLVEHFPSSFFIGVQREVFQVVNSMLNHKGVLRWFKTVSNNKTSRFLGINERNISYYKDLPIEAKCTLRWLSHTAELKLLQEKYPASVLIFDYQELCTDFNTQVDRFDRLLSLNLKDYAETPNLESLNKYKNLTNEQIAIIEDTIAKEADFFKVSN